MTGGLNVLVIGAGMYAVGRGGQGFGTILPALFEGRRRGLVDRIGFVATRAKSAAEAALKARELGGLMQIEAEVDHFPKEKDDDQAYLRALSEFRPDAVIVAVPDDLHARVSLPFIEAKVHCLMVKPLAADPADAALMTEAARKAGIVAQVEFHKRLDESNLLLRDKIRRGLLGRPLYAVIEYSQRKSVPTSFFRAWAERTTIFQYLGVHYVDLLLFATGYTPKKVSAWAQSEYLTEQGIATPDSMQVVIEWENERGGPFVSTHITNWIDPEKTSAMSDQKIMVVGTAGRYQADQKNRGVSLVTDENGVEEVNPYFTSARLDEDDVYSFTGYGIESVLRFCRDASACVRGEISSSDIEKGRPTFAQGLISTAVTAAAHQSLRAGSIPVEVCI